MPRLFRWILRLRFPVLGVLLAVTAWLGSELYPPESIRFDFSFGRLFISNDSGREVLRQYQEDFGTDVGFISVLFDRGDDGAAPPPERVTGSVFEPRILEAMQALAQRWVDGPTFIREDVSSPVTAANLLGEAIEPRFLAHELRALEAAAAEHGDWSAQKAVEAFEQAGRDPPPPGLAAAVLRYRAAKALLLDHRVYVGRLLSTDGLAGGVFGRFDPERTDDAERQAAVGRLPDHLERIRERLPSDTELHVSGVPVIQNAYKEVAVHDLVTFIPLVLAMMVVLLLALFRRLHAVVLPVTAVGLAVVWGLGYMQLQGVPINMLNNVIPVIVAVIGVADGVHILARYHQTPPEEMPPPPSEGGPSRRERAAAHDEIIVRTMCRMAPPCLLTSLTTAIGFASLMTARIPTVRAFGIYAAWAIGFAFVMQMTLVPIGLSLARPQPLGDPDRGTGGRLLAAMARFVLRRGRAVGVITAGVVAICVIGILQVKNEAHVVEELQADHPITRALYRTQEKLSGVLVHGVTIHGRSHPEQSCSRDRDCRIPDCDPEACSFPGCCHTRVCDRVDRVWRATSRIQEGVRRLTGLQRVQLLDDLQQHLGGLRSRAGAGDRDGLVVEDAPPEEGSGTAGESAELVVEDDPPEPGSGRSDAEREQLEIVENPETKKGSREADTPAEPTGEGAAEDPFGPGIEGRCVESVSNAALIETLEGLDDWLEHHDEHADVVSRVDGLPDLLLEMERAIDPSDAHPDAFDRPLDRGTIENLIFPLSSAGNELLSRYLTPDRTRTQLAIRTRDAGTSAREELLTDLRAELRARFDDDPALAERFDWHVTGSSTLAHRALQSIMRDLGTSMAIAFGFIFVLLAFEFRSLRVAAVSMLPNVLPLAATLALMGWTGITLRMSTAVIFSVALGIAVDDTIHFLARYREEVRERDDLDQALVRTVQTTGRAIGLTTVILACGFSVNVFSEFSAMQDFGRLTAFTLVVAFLGDVLVLPVAARRFGLARPFRRGHDG